MPNRGSVEIILKASDRRFRAAMNRVIAVMERVRKRMEAAARAARRVLLAATTAATGASIAWASFEDRMVRVKALANATQAEFEILMKTARDLGKRTRFSANQAADAMAAFALLGFKTHEIVKAMIPTLDLAAVGQLQMGQAAEITAGVMRAMKIPVEDLTSVVDVLAKASTTSATTIPELGEAMKAVGPVAKTAGLSLEQTIAIIQAFSDVMIKGSAAGTALRNILLRLQAQPAEVRKALAALNVSIANSSGDFRHMGDIIDDLNAAFEGMGDTQRNAMVGQIAGMKAVAGFTELLTLSGDVVREYEARLKNITGTARKMSKEFEDTVAGAFDIAKSAATELGIKIGEDMNEEIRAFLDAVTKMLNKFNDMDEATTRNLVTIAKWGAAFAAVVAGIPAAALGFKVLAKSALILKGIVFGVAKAIGVLIGLPLTPWVLAAIGVVASLLKLFGKLDEVVLKVVEGYDKVIEKLKEILGLTKDESKAKKTKIELMEDELKALALQRSELNTVVKKMREQAADERRSLSPQEVKRIETIEKHRQKLLNGIKSLRQQINDILDPPEQLPPARHPLAVLADLLQKKMKKIEQQRLEATKDAKEFLAGINKEIDELTPGFELRELERKMSELRQLGADPEILKEIRRRFNRLQRMKEGDLIEEDVSGTGRFEGLQETFRRISEAAAGSDTVQKQQLGTQQRTESNTAKAVDVLKEVVKSIIGLPSELNMVGRFAP